MFCVCDCTIHSQSLSQICKKRGPLGACLEQVERTADNDNDKASKYFREPVVKSRITMSDEDVAATDSNELIQKLRQQTLDNKERNELYVKTQTAINDQVCKACFYIIMFSHIMLTTMHFLLVCILWSIRSECRYTQHGWKDVFSVGKSTSHASQEGWLYSGTSFCQTTYSRRT